MKKQLLVGVDGGASKSFVRIEDSDGKLIGETISGPANIRNSVEQSWQSIMHAFYSITNIAAINPADYELHAGMGLAGTEHVESYQAFINFPHIFDSLIVKSDAHVACLAAHAGKDGGIIIVGTGVVGYQIVGDHVAIVGGWGFPQDDEGGGAWMGLEAMKLTFRVVDKRALKSGLSDAIFQHFKEDQNAMVHFATLANSTIFGTLAPIVIEQSKLGDGAALHIVKQAANAIDHLGHTLIKQSKPHYHDAHPIPISLVGSIAPYLQPYLSESLRAHVRPCQLSLAKGAIILIQESFAKGEYAL